jgi:hypothetical protein
MKTFTKQPGERLAYDIDLTDWFQALIDTDEIDTAALSVVSATDDDPAGITASLNATLLGTPPTVIKVWVESGLDGVDYQLTVRATTIQGRIKEVDFRVRVKEI